VTSINDEQRAEEPPELLAWPCPACGTDLLRLPYAHGLGLEKVSELVGKSLLNHRHGAPYVQNQIDVWHHEDLDPGYADRVQQTLSAEGPLSTRGVERTAEPF